ncbi:hypothetical protein SAMN05421878_11434 [Actinobaculum suis]|uniref:Uncharacterized protein n=1 Tax=Actinobaculum suis TaxID=1657 RepID=A0A1G7E1R6_9ACTO|nr:hypothetical protein SAMN05421878_11434 [Actinobaculum suis]
MSKPAYSPLAQQLGRQNQQLGAKTSSLGTKLSRCSPAPRHDQYYRARPAFHLAQHGPACPARSALPGTARFTALLVLLGAHEIHEGLQEAAQERFRTRIYCAVGLDLRYRIVDISLRLAQ